MVIVRTLLYSMLLSGSLVCGAAETAVEQRSGGDMYAAGVSVEAAGPVEGDAVLAGGTVLVTGPVAQDVLAAGGSLTLTGPVQDDVRAAGGSITLTDRVGGDAIVAGGTVTLATSSVVDGNAWLAGGVLRLTGSISGDLRAAGGEIIVDGRVDGDADVYAESLEIRPGTVIAGRLHYRGPRPAVIAEGAQVGEVVYTESRALERPGVSRLGGLLASLVFFLSLAVSALLVGWLTPGACRKAIDNARHQMLLSLGVGVLTAIVTPLLVAVLFVLVLTGPVAAVLVAAYVAALVLGALTAVACFADWLRERFWSARGEGAGIRIVAMLAAALVFWLVGLVPFIGAIIVILAFTTGLGGLILLATRLYKQAEPA